MTLIGMIYQYDCEQNMGLLMVPGGDKKEFSINDWTDSVNSPAVGQKIAYIVDANRVEIKVASEEDINNAATDKEENSKGQEPSTDTENQFANLDECLKYFVDKDFRVVKDTHINESQVLTLRKYTDVEYGEAIVTYSGSKISIDLTLNGKPAVIS